MVSGVGTWSFRAGAFTRPEIRRRTRVAAENKMKQILYTNREEAASSEKAAAAREETATASAVGCIKMRMHLPRSNDVAAASAAVAPSGRHYHGSWKGQDAHAPLHHREQQLQNI